MNFQNDQKLKLKEAKKIQNKVIMASQTAQNAQPPLAPVNHQKPGSSIVLKSLSILLGLFFIFIGAMKLTPHLSKELHKDLVSK